MVAMYCRLHNVLRQSCAYFILLYKLAKQLATIAHSFDLKLSYTGWAKHCYIAVIFCEPPAFIFILCLILPLSFLLYHILCLCTPAI